MLRESGVASSTVGVNPTLASRSCVRAISRARCLRVLLNGRAVGFVGVADSSKKSSSHSCFVHHILPIRIVRRTTPLTPFVRHSHKVLGASFEPPRRGGSHGRFGTWRSGMYFAIMHPNRQTFCAFRELKIVSRNPCERPQRIRRKPLNPFDRQMFI
jgi:hypothetical protein